MKNINILILTFFVFLIACNTKPNESKEINKIPRATSSEISDTSIFNIEHQLRNQFSDTIQFKDFSGKPTIMALVYTTCTFSCPRIIADMREVEAAIPEDKASEINFVLISIDPEVDQPDTLKAFMIANEMDENRWTLLNGTNDQIQDIAAVIGFKYKKSSLMDYAHSNLITVFDQNGNWLLQTEGFGGDKQEIVDVLLNALK